MKIHRAFAKIIIKVKLSKLCLYEYNLNMLTTLPHYFEYKIVNNTIKIVVYAIANPEELHIHFPA